MRSHLNICYSIFLKPPVVSRTLYDIPSNERQQMRMIWTNKKIVHATIDISILVILSLSILILSFGIDICPF